MNKKIIKFGDTEIEKQKFQQHESSILTNNIDINKLVVSNRVSFGEKGFKHFIDYKYAKKKGPLCMFLSKMRVYKRDFDETKYMPFLIKDEYC